MSSPKPPSPPKIQEIDQYQSYKQHPLYKQWKDDGNGGGIDDNSDLMDFNSWILEQEFETARNDDTFRKAEMELLTEGLLMGGRDLDFDDDDALEFRRRFKKKGEKGNWKSAYYEDSGLDKKFSYTHRGDLQSVYDRVYEIEQAEYDEEYQAGLDEAQKEYLKQQKADKRQQNQMYRKSMRDMRIQNRKQGKENKQMQREMMQATKEDAQAQRKNQRKMQRQQIRSQKQMQRQADKSQKEMMEAMMDQPIYSPQQARLPEVQYKAKAPAPMPVAPTPPPQMNISAAPVPELVNTGNPMGIVRQSSTARSRTRQRTRGTSSLT